MDTVDRIFELVDQKYSEQRQFAVTLGIAPSAVSNWRRRKSDSYNKRIPQIAEVLGTTVEYLLTGDSKKDSSTAAVGPLSLSRQETALVLAYRKADERTRQMVDLALEPYNPPASTDAAM